MAKKSFWGRLVEGFKAPNSSKGKQQKKKKRNETPRSERSINRSDVGRKSKGSSHTSNRNSNRETPRNERPVSRQVGSQQNKTRSTGTQRTTRSGAYRPNQVADLSERSVRMKSPTDRSGTGFKPKKHTKVENLTERATRKPTVNGKEVNTSINKAAAANKDFKRTAPKSIKKFSRGTSVAGDVVKYAGKDLVGTGLKMTAGVFDGPKKKQVANTDYKKFGDSLKNASKLKSGGTKYKPTNTTGMGYKRDSKGNLVTDVQYGAKAKSFQNKLNKEANKWEKSANKDVKDAVKGLSNKAKYDIPDLGPINKIMGMESAKDQRKRARDEINKTYSAEWKKQKTAIAKEFDDYVASQGLSADSMLNIDGKTMSVAEYRKKYLKDAYKETLLAMKTQKAKDIKDTSNIGKISARDIGEMGIKGGVEMAEILIPYGGSAKASLKAADLLMGAGKAAKAGSKAAKGAKVLTSIEKEGARALSADGKAFVRKAFKEGFANGKKTADIVDDITKQVVRSDLKQNIKREIIANALQDASIGATIDVASAKKQGLEGKDLAKYMAQSAAMNAVMGAPVAGIAGRTGRAGKTAIKSDIVRNVNDEFVSIGKLAPEKSRELFNLIQRRDNGVKLTTDEAKRLKTLQNEQITNRSGVVQMDAKGNIVVNDADVVKSVFSEPELKEYTKLRARESAGLPISKSDAVRMQEIDGKIKYAYQAVEHNANNVIKLGEKNLSKIGRSNLESAVEYFKKTGETTKLNKAMKMLDKDIKIATERNEAITKAINTMTDRTGINYRLVSNDEMGKLVGGQKSTEGYLIRGEYRTVNKETGEVEIVINKDASQAHQTIIGHETGHLIKDNNEEEFLKLGDMLRDYAKKQDAKGYESFEKMMRESYPDLNDVDFNEEITCELLGRTIFGEDDAFIKRLAGENPTLLRRIVEYVKNLGQKIQHPELNAQLKAMTEKAEELIGEVKVEDVKANRAEAEEARKIMDAQADDVPAEVLKEQGPEPKYSRVKDDKTLEFLNKQEAEGKTVETYRAMVMIDGKLYPPMATKLKSAEKGGKAKLQDPNELGTWVQADEHPELLDKNGKFVLKKDKGTPVPAAYNPYIHSSFSPLNDQFTSAWKRPNLVVVKGLVPESELTSGYKAVGAKDAVGKTQWHSGVVAGQLPKAREVMLSRWFKPTEVMDDADVASIIKETLGDTGIEIPYNVVTPGLRKELENIGVPIGEGRGGAPKEIPALEGTPDKFSKSKIADVDTKGRSISKEQQEYFADTTIRQKNGKLKPVYHGSPNEFDVFKRGDIGFHLGTKAQARTRVGKKGNVVEYYGNLRKPIEFDVDLGSWDADYKLADRLVEMDVITREEANNVLRTESGKRQSTGKANELLRNLLKEKGYDGISYKNAHEGSGNSYILFDSNQAKRVDNVSPTESPNTKFSKEKIAEDHRNEMLSDIEEMYGERYTNDFNETGFIFPDGKLPRMGMDGMRAEDHNIAIGLYDDIDYSTSQTPKADAMGRFLEEGNIRIMPENGSIEMSANVRPTQEQFNAIRRFLDEHDSAEIEFSGSNGRSVDSKAYENGVNSSQVINDIKRFYNDGKIGGSELNNFRDKFSIEKIVKDENGNTHENVVRLDTDVFDGLKTRKEKESKLHDFVYEHFAGNKFKAYDDDGNPVTIEFAREGESHKKIGAKRKQKTLDEIADKPSHGMRRVKTQKAAAQADELIEVSKFDRTSDANVHGKLDKNGWEYRTLKVMDGDGGIYDCVLSIAKTEDGRNILYDIKIKNKIGQDVEAAKSDSPVSPISKDRVSEPSSEVKEKFSKQKPNDTDRAAGRDIDELRRLDAEGKLNEAGKAKLDRLETRITEAEPPKKMPKRLAPKKEIPKAEAFRKAQEPKDKHSRERLDDYSESAINKFVAENEELAKGGKFTDSSGYKPPETESLPKSVVRNLRQDKSSKKEAREALVAHTVNPEKLTDERAEAFNKDFDRVSALIYNGDTGGARQVAEDIAREFGQVDDFELREIPDLWENIKTAQDIMRKTLLHMPQSDHSGRSGSFKDFKEALGEYDRHVLRVRKSTSGKEWSRGVDEVYEELSQELPDLFPRGVDSPDEQFKILAEVSKMNKKSASMSSVISEEEVESFYQEIARSIYDAAEKNASKFKDSSLKADIQQRKAKTPQGEQKKVIEPVKEKTVPDENPLTAKDVDNSEQAKMDGVPETKPKEKPVINNTPVTDMTDEALKKEARSLDYVINVRGKTPEHQKLRKERLKEINAELKARAGGDAGDYRPEGSKTPGDAPVRSKPEKNTPETKVKPVDYDVPAGNKVLDRSWLGDKTTSARRLIESSLVGFEQAANKTGNKQLANQINNVIMYRNRFSAWIEGSRTGLDRQITGDGLNKIYSDAGLFGKKNAAKKADFANYLTYKHAIDRLNADKPVHLDPETGMSRYTVEDYERFIKEIENNYSKDELKAFEKGIRGYYDDLMKMRVDAGLVSKEFADDLAKKYPHYVPTYREGDEWLKGVADNSGGKNLEIKQTIQTAKGGSQEIQDLYQQTFDLTREAIRNAEENRLMNMYVDAMDVKVDELPKGTNAKDVLDVAISATGNTKDGWRVTFFNDGKAYQMPADKQIVKGLREFNGQDFRRLINASSKMSGPMRAFKGLITDYNPIFGVRNGMRDFQQALVNSKDTTQFVKALPSAWEAIASKGDNEFFKLYEANGGKYSAFVYQDSKVMEPGSGSTLRRASDASFGKALQKIEDFNGAIELTPRLMEFIGTLNKNADTALKKKGSSLKIYKDRLQDEMFPKTKQLSNKQLAEFENEFAKRVIDMADSDVIDAAMRNSADITLNFSRNGVIGKALNMGVVPYFNPSIQGLSKMVRMFTESKADGTLLNFGMKLGVITLAPAAVNEIFMADNKDYQMLSTREKDTNYFIPLGDGKFMKIPKPRENAVLAEPVEYGLRFFFDHAQYGEVKKGEYLNKATWKQMFVSGWDNIGPTNPFSDNIYSPLIRLAQNKTWYGGSIESTAEVLQKKEGELKNSEISDETTSAIAKWIGETKVGGSTVSDITHMSPKKIDDFMDSYLGMIYDLGISQTSERSREEMSLKNNPITNQFIKDSVFSNKNGMELWSEFDKAMQPKTVKGKLVKGAKNMLLGNSAWNIDEKNDAANDWLNYKGYDDITYSSGVATVRGYDDLSKAKKENIIRRIKRAQNDFRRDLVYGEKKVTPEKDPIRTFADIFGVDKAMKDFTFTHTNKETGEKTNQHLDAWKEYKKTDTYKKSDSSGKNFLDFYCDMRYTNGEIGVSKSQPSWMTASILAANKKGNNDDLGLSYIKPSWDDDNRTSAKEILQRGKNLASADFGQKEHIREEKAIFTSGRKLGYDYRNELNPWDEAMSLATNKKYKFDDRNYYAADTSGKVSRRMNYARCLNEKGYSTKQIYDFAKEYDIKIPKTANMSKDQYVSTMKAFNAKVESAVRDKYGDKPLEEQAAIYHVITEDRYNKPFGDVGDYSMDSDTGITELDAKSSGGGYGYRRRRRRGYRRRHYGGHGGGGGGGSMPKTESGTYEGKITDAKVKKLTAKDLSLGHHFKAKVSNTSKTSNTSKPSNLNDAYRKRINKLMLENTKKLY